jgi:hypothetical protein
MSPFLAMITVLMGISWAIFVKSSMQRAVRVAVDQGVSLTASQLASGACLTDTLKATVQRNSFGMLNGNSGLALIKVNYFQPPAAGSASAATDVSAQTTANSPGNIMQVSVQNFSLMPLIPRFVDFSHAADNTPMNTSVYSAGVIQLTQTTPCVGTAP